MTKTQKKRYWQGARDTLPLIFAAMPFGIVYGAMAQAQGLPMWVTMAISLCVFAGASQFIAITLLATGAPLNVIVLTVFIVNLRHMLYAISLIPFVQKISQAKRIPMAFTLTDETFAVALNYASRFHQGLPGPGLFSSFYLGSGALMYFSWVMCSAIGVMAGSQLPELTQFGLDIAMVVAFIGIVVPHLTLPSHWICVVVAGISGALLYDWPNQTGLLASAFLAIFTGVVTENLFSQKENHDQQKQLEQSS